MIDEALFSVIIVFGIPGFLSLFVLFTPSKAKWILDARYMILYGNTEWTRRLLRRLKGKFKK